MALSLGGGSRAIAFLVAAGITYEIIAKDCSSPQTTQINIKERGGTLMKWVHIGQVESMLFIGIAAIVEKETRWAVLLGGSLAMAITEAEYLHAKQAGLASPGPSTENKDSTEKAFAW